MMLAIGLVFYMLSPPLYWKLAQGAAHSRLSGACNPCACDCMLDTDSMLLPGFGNTPSSDCEKLQEEVDQKSVDLLTEELKLQETVAEESQRRADSALLDAKKVASQYQKEAEKCSSGMETCEEAREKSEAELAAQKKVSAMWEKRARELGWRDRQDHQSIFDRIGLSAVTIDGQADSFLFKRARKI